MSADEENRATRRPGGESAADTVVDRPDAGAAATGLGEGRRGAARARFEPGAKIDRFIVEEMIGSGGMGVVLAAHEPDLDRRVALKLLRPELGAQRELVKPEQRLLREAQAMAKLSHPNVVKVHAVGTVGDEVFVAMEYVDGQTLSGWLKEQPRSWQEVVEVFASAGQGLAAAHRAKLVHRDFKPDNVLIGKNGRVSVTDFGLVSVSGMPVEASGPDESAESDLSGETPLSTSLTRTGTLLGTPVYMSPEQHGRKVVDARSDQFAYCVALYEALYGELPFGGSTYHELADRVTEGTVREPPASSSVPSWVRGALLRGLRVKPEDRFDSMEALGAALTHDPRAVRRRRLRVAALALAFVAVAAVAAFGLLRGETDRPACVDARAELAGIWDGDRRRAVRQAFAATERTYAKHTTKRVERILDDYAAAWSAMRKQACEATRVHGTQSERHLDLRMRCLNRRRARLAALTELFARGPDASVLANAIHAADSLAAISPCADLAALEARAPLPADPAVRQRIEELARLRDEAETLAKAGKYKDGLRVAELVVADARKIDYPPSLADAAQALAELQVAAGLDAEAEASFREAIGAAAEAKDDRSVAKAHINLIWVIGYRRARYDEALALRPAAEAAVARAGGDEILRASLAQTVGDVIVEIGQYSEAEKLLRQALAIEERVLGPEHTGVSATLHNLALVISQQGRDGEARPLYERAVSILEKRLGSDHPDVAALMGNLASLWAYAGELDKARAGLERVIRIQEGEFGTDYRELAYPLVGLGDVYMMQERYEDARASYARSLAIAEKAVGTEHPKLGYPLNGLGTALVALDKLEEAIPVLERALALRETIPDAYPEVAESCFQLARALWIAGKERARARALARRARDAYAAAGEGLEQELGEVKAWMAKRGAK